MVDRLRGTDQSLTVLLDDELSPEGMSATIAQVAREALVEAQQTNEQALGRVPDHETVVDGRRGAALETVRPDGTVVFVFDVGLVNDALIWISGQLVTHSPVLRGRYMESHVLFADDVEVAGGELTVASAIPQAREYAFVNAQPYARKIERGLSKQAPEGVYQSVAALARRRFGNVASIKFSYRSFRGGPIGSWAARTDLQSHSPSRNRPGVKREDWLTRQPAVIVTMR